MTPEIEELKKQRNALNDRIREAESVEMQKRSGFAIGDAIEFTRAKRTVKGRVVGVRPWVGTSPELEVSVIRKDGSEGATTKVLPYDNPRHAVAG